MNKNRFTLLFERYMAKTATSVEREELFGMALDPGRQDQLDQLLQEAWLEAGEEHDLSAEAVEILFSKIRPKPKVVPIWKRWAAAAAILVAISITGYFTFFHKSTKPVITEAKPGTDVSAPSSTRATITLANGRKVLLDSAATGMLANESSVAIRKTSDGKIVYEESNNSSGEIIYNTLENPRGSQVINMTLADGSQLWLNAGSSVTYPVSFKGNQRIVSMKGEVYFEVTHNSAKPFIVSNGNTHVQVLGTHFNVNAYDNESDLKVTLLEGSVKVNTTLIKPGQQAVVGKEISVKNDIDLDAVMAWKNGLFNFNGIRLREVMKQLERWYDIEVVYENNVPDLEFYGELNRTISLAGLIKALKSSGVKLEIQEGRKLMVMK